MAKKETLGSTFLEQDTAEAIREIMWRGITELQEVIGELEPKHVVQLEKYARIHSILMADMRETVKSGLLTALSDEELLELDEEPE